MDYCIFLSCQSVVEETLVGRDPDVADDLAGNDLSIDKILRSRCRYGYSEISDLV